jgi:hypothetical protein
MKINWTASTASVVAGAAFLASAQHIASVAEHAGNPPFIAWIHAIGIDGLILIGINALGKARGAAVVAIIYGAVVSLLFNAASYGAFEMHPFALAVTMPGALVLAYITQHASAGHGTAGHEDTGQRVAGQRATRTEVDVHVRRERVPAVPRQDTPTVLDHKIHPSGAERITYAPGTVVQPVPERKAIERKPVTRDWDVTEAGRLIRTTHMSNAEIGAQVGTSYKTIQRLRSQIKNGATE